MDEHLAKFLERVWTGAMVTVRRDGSAHVARLKVGLVDGKIWVSGTQTRVRTKHVRANPKATLFVFDAKSGDWAGIEGQVTIHEGPDAWEKCLALQRVTGREPDNLDAFRQRMLDEQRLVYEFSVDRVYGAYGQDEN